MRPPIRPAVLTLLALAAACRAADGPNASRDSAVLAEAGSAARAVVAADAAAPSLAVEALRDDGAAKMARPAPAAPPAPAMSPASAVAGVSTPAPAPGDPAPLVIRTGSAAVEVDSLDAGVARLRAAVQAIPGAYVANLSFEGGREQARRATLEVKVPARDFDRLVEGLAPIGRVETVNVAAEDVSEEYVDLTARAENARRLEARLVELLARRTGKLGDVLAVERELARVREEIERHDGRLRFLRTRAAVSTLAVTIHEPTPVLGAPTTHNPLADAFRQSWRNLVGFVAALIAAAGVLVPLGVLAYLAWRVARRFRRPAPVKEAAAA